MFSSDNDFSKFKNIYICIVYFIIGITCKDNIFDVIDDNCST